MALSDESSMVMPVSPMGGYGNNGFGGDWSVWIILFILMAFGNGGWGNGFGGGNQLGYDFPWLLNSNNNTDALVTAGFNNQATATALSGIQGAVTSGFGDVQLGIAGVNQNICQTGNGIVNALNTGFAGAEAAANARQIADMQQNFANQTATLQGFNGLQSQLANCCCNQQLATANLGADIAREACADRAAVSNGVRDIIASQTAGTQAILDKLCQQEIDNLKTANSNLQTQVLMRDLAASQASQTSALMADNAAQTQYVVNRVAPYPIPAYTVPSPYGYGNCGCGYGVA